MSSVTETLKEQHAAYAAGHDRPLGSYLVTMAVYGGLVGGLTALARRTRRRPPELRPWDLFVMTVATHRVARTLAKDPVTSPLRAPFTTYEGTSGPAEVAESPRGGTTGGEGARHAVGELLSCPFCTAQWVATGYAAGLVFAPRATRLAGATMAAVAGADWLQLGYARLQQAATG
jgi:hypothetical protein